MDSVTYQDMLWQAFDFGRSFQIRQHELLRPLFYNFSIKCRGIFSTGLEILFPGIHFSWYQILTLFADFLSEIYETLLKNIPQIVLKPFLKSFLRLDAIKFENWIKGTKRTPFPTWCSQRFCFLSPVCENCKILILFAIFQIFDHNYCIILIGNCFQAFL